MTVFLEVAPAYANLLEYRQFEHCVLTALENQGIPLESDVTIVVDNDVHIQQLNHEFLGNNIPTDVLAFPAGHIDPDTAHTYLGDVIISYPRAKVQAEKAEHSISSELNLLVAHGVLHLLGYDHDRPELKADMWAAQAQILSKLDVQIKSQEFST